MERTVDENFVGIWDNTTRLPILVNTMRDRSHRLSKLSSLLLGSFIALVASLPVQAAERIIFSYGLLERSISLEALEEFAEEGTVSPNLRLVFGFLDEEAEQDFREALNTVTNLDPVAIANSFYSPLGERSLNYIGDIIQTESGLNGNFALRSAVILSASQPDGFQPTDVLQNFPTDAVRIDLIQLLANARQVEEFFQETDNVIAGIAVLSEAAEAADLHLNLAALPDITGSGPYEYAKETIRLTDPSRDRTYPVDLYIPLIKPNLPLVEQGTSGTVPVIVISHGLAAQRSDFADMAQHFASYGFMVALPEHIGSNKALQEAVLEGVAFEFFYPSEFIDRPLDISYLLDVLERLNQTEWGNRLDLNNVTAMGHSFGGYTVLALGGATANFDYLRNACAQESFSDFLNPALVLQCRALELAESNPMAAQQLMEGVRDERIDFVVAVNPINRSIFGPQGLQDIQIPIVIVAGGYDIAAPIVPEQVYSFTQIASPIKYLLLIEGQAHAPALSATINQVLNPSLTPEELERTIQVVRDDAIALLMAFAKVYGAGHEAFLPYLTSAYAERLDEPPFEFSLIRTLTEEQLEAMLAGDWEDILSETNDDQ